MRETTDLTSGNVRITLLKFALPYLLAAFMQTFYGIADMFVVGMYNGASTITAVSIGSQVMHMITVVILGFAMGTTVNIGRHVGERNQDAIMRTVRTTIFFFALMAAILLVGLLVALSGIVTVMNTPIEAVGETAIYLKICFVGIPFIIAYNVISSIFRGMGDSRSPMYFIGIACGINIILDFILIGPMGLGSLGAALGTVLGQTSSVVISLIYIRKKKVLFKVEASAQEASAQEASVKKKWFYTSELKDILSVGTPIALQDGFIQIAFIVITIIANARGLIDAAAVGIVEKIICFMFLVPSAFLSAISAMTAQNIGAGKRKRAKQALYFGLLVSMVWGILCAVYNQFLPQTLVSLFTSDALVLASGCLYLKSYSFDTFFAGIHFCMSGFFCGDQKSGISFLHNVLSILLIRIPGAYFASKLFPDSLYPMGWAAPMGSLLSALICIGFFIYYSKKEQYND